MSIVDAQVDGFPKVSNMGAEPVSDAVPTGVLNWAEPLKTGSPVDGSWLLALAMNVPVQLSNSEKITKTYVAVSLPGMVVIWSACADASTNVQPSAASPSKSTNASLLRVVHAGPFGWHRLPGPSANAVLKPATPAAPSINTATSSATTKLTTSRDDLTGDAGTLSIDRPSFLNHEPAAPAFRDS